MLNSINDGAQELLKDTINVLKEYEGLEYIIIGGWCPLLRNKTDITHPGTLDVDILFKEAYQSENLKLIIKDFITHNFIPSAKHPFQMLKKQTIKTQDFIYNIDLLHPKMTEEKENIGMFIDHLDLDVPIDNEELNLKKACSIVLPNSEILFSKKLYDTFVIEDIPFNLVNFNGMFITKMESCQKQKRERDSFDIYLAFINKAIDNKLIKELADSNIHIKKSLDSFKKFLKKKPDTFNKNVVYFDKSITGSPASYILTELQV